MRVDFPIQRGKSEEELSHKAAQIEEVKVMRRMKPVGSLMLLALLTACPAVQHPPLPQNGEMTVVAKARTPDERKLLPDDEAGLVSLHILTALPSQLSSSQAGLPADYPAFEAGTPDMLSSSELLAHHFKLRWQTRNSQGKTVQADWESRVDFQHLYLRLQVQSDDVRINTYLVEQNLRQAFLNQPGITLVARED